MARVVLRGRGEEVTQILGVLRGAARTGRGAMIVITGEPGIGKSALLRVANEQAARAGFAVGTSKAEEIDQIVPGAPLLVSLRSGPHPLLDGDAFASLAPLYERELWLVDRIAALLEEIASATGVVIAIDDIHWADPLTRLALRILPGRLAGSSVVWVLTSRLCPADVAEELIAAADDAITITRVQLGPLKPEDIDDLALDHLSRAPAEPTRQLLHGVGGNPFWAVQVLDGLARNGASDQADGDLRARLVTGIRLRLQPLPSDVVGLVRLAAVWGRTLAVEDAEALLGGVSASRVLAAARLAADEGLLRTGGGVFFAHDILREAVYADIAPGERSALHRACARYILAAGGGILTAAPHFQASATADDEEAVRALQSAAEECVISMPEQAARLTREAFGLLSREHPLWLSAGERALAVLVDVHREREAVTTADRLLDAADDPETVARIQAQACRALWCTGACLEIEKRANTALRLHGVPDTLRARLKALRALASTRTGSAAVAADIARSELAEGRRLGDSDTQRLALLARVEAASNEGRNQLALDRFAELRPFSLQTHLGMEIRLLQQLDRYDDAESKLAQRRRDARNNVGNMLPSLLHAQVWQDHDLARFDAAEAGAQTLLRVADEVGNFAYKLSALMVLSGVAIYRGDVPRARALLSPGEAEEVADEAQLSRLRLMQGWLSAEEGDVPTAVAILEPVLSRAGDSLDSWPWSPPWMRTLAGIGVAAGHPQFAQAAAAIAELGAKRNPTVASLHGVALQTRGIADNDLAMLGKAVDVLRHAPRPLLLADALADHGRALLVAGRQADGISFLEEAFAIYDRLCAERGTRITADALRNAGVRKRRRPMATRRAAGGWDSLTEAEFQVVELISAGHTNRSAAAKLGVSASTVGTHLQSVYGKLHIRSRVQLTNALHQRSSTETDQTL